MIFFYSCRDFLTECLFPSPTRPYELPWEQKTIWAIIFGVMLFVAIAGNAIVLWIVTGKYEKEAKKNKEGKSTKPMISFGKLILIRKKQTKKLY